MDITGIELSKLHLDFPGIKWTIRALYKEKIKAIKNLLFESGRWVATDGHRMHIYKSIESFREGLYKPVINNNRELVLKLISDDVKKYPDWNNFPWTKKTPLELKITLPRYPSVTYTNIIRCLEVSVTLDFRFVDDLLRKSSDLWTVHIYEKSDPVHFVSDRKIGIIMPMHT